MQLELAPPEWCAGDLTPPSLCLCSVTSLHSPCALLMECADSFRVWLLGLRKRLRAELRAGTHALEDLLMALIFIEYLLYVRAVFQGWRRPSPRLQVHTLNNAMKSKAE